MRTPRVALAACALLAVTACDAPAAGDGAAGGASVTAEISASAGESVTRFGDEYRFRSGIVVAVSEPKSFQPSKIAYPQSENAVAFEITVHNETGSPYRLSEMAVTVVANGSETSQIIDPTQGYTGVADSETGLPTDGEAQVNLAFTAPAELANLKLTFRPHKTRAVGVTYVGERNGASAR